MANPVISALTYTVTDTTIVAVWTTDISADSNLFAGAKAAIDNGVAASGTSHQCIVTGLTPKTDYSCHVVSGATTGSTSVVTTNPVQNRIPILSATNGATSTFSNTGGGDSIYTFVSSDGISYATMNDGHGLTGSANGGANSQICKFTNNATLAGSDVNLLTSYGGLNSPSGADGPAGVGMRAACYGPFSINGNLFMFMARNDLVSATWYGNVIMDHADHGATWNKFTVPGTWNANGVGPCDGVTNADIHQYAQTYYGFAHPVLYAADDGTLGYNTAGNQIDGANGFVYVVFQDSSSAIATTTLYMLRWPRISFAAQDNSTIKYWVGPASPAPTDFVNDSNWSASDASKQAIITRSYISYTGRVAFIPAINRYVMLDSKATTVSNTDFVFYEAPTPAGPWTQFFTQNNNPTGWIVPAFMHADLITNTKTDFVTARILYGGDYQTSDYQPHASTLTLVTTTPPSPPANTFVQGANSFPATGTTGALAYSGNVASGNLLVACGRAAGTATSVTDNLGDSVSWTLVYSTSDGTGAGTSGWWAWKFAGASAACTVTVHFSGSSAGQAMCIGEWHGPNTLRTTPPAGKLTSGTPVSSNAIATVAGDLIVGVAEDSGGSPGPPTAGTGYTMREQIIFSGTSYNNLEDNLNSAGGSVTANWVGFAIAPNVNVLGVGAWYNLATEYSISGAAGIAGATVSWTGTASGSVVADSSGNYTIPNLFAGSYTVTPSFGGYTFSPANRAETITTANITGVNFTASVATVVGNAGSLSLRRRLRKNVIS